MRREIFEPIEPKSCHEQLVAPRLIANAEDIGKLAVYEDEDVAALHGCRAEDWHRLIGLDG